MACIPNWRQLGVKWAQIFVLPDNLSYPWCLSWELTDWFIKESCHCSLIQSAVVVSLFCLQYKRHKKLFLHCRVPIINNPITAGRLPVFVSHFSCSFWSTPPPTFKQSFLCITDHAVPHWTTYSQTQEPLVPRIKDNMFSLFDKRSFRTLALWLWCRSEQHQQLSNAACTDSLMHVICT